MLFWRKNRAGYTSNLDDCELFSLEEATRLHENRPSDIPYKKDAIDAISKRHVDLQDLRKIEV